MTELLLSLFPGIDLFGRAFEEEGDCIVRGPDLIWGSDIRGFHPPAGVFQGVIGGPPCQAFSALRHLIRHNGHEPRFGNMIPEYERVVFEAQPVWFLMEEVPDAPVPHVEGYITKDMIIRDMWVGGLQPRPRRFSFGTRDGRELDIAWAALMKPEAQGTVALIASDSGIAYEEKRRAGTQLGRGGPYGAEGKRKQSMLADGRRVPVKIGGSGRVKRSVVGDARKASTGDRVRSKEKGGGPLPAQGSVLPIEDACEAMGLPRDFTEHMPFTMHGKRSVIGNGVPMAMGRAVAKAVHRALADRQ